MLSLRRRWRGQPQQGRRPRPWSGSRWQDPRVTGWFDLDYNKPS